jgi:tetratricopeptide (TPR) repeat protein
MTGLHGIALGTIFWLAFGFFLPQGTSTPPLNKQQVTNLFQLEKGTRTLKGTTQEQVEQFGVDFELDSQTEQEFQKLGMLSPLRDAIRDNLRTGTLTIQCAPVDCEVSINNEAVGSTIGFTMTRPRVLAGRVVVTVTAADYLPQTTETELMARRPLSLTFRLLPKSLQTVEDLYYRAKFEEAASLLAELDMRPHRMDDLKKLRLYQALVEIGLDHNESAKARFLELLALDPTFSVSSGEYSARIVEVFNEARKAFADNQCKKGCSDCEAAARGGDFQKAIEIARPFRLQCPCAQQALSSVAKSLVDRGTASLQRGDYSRGINDFNMALEADAENQVALKSIVTATDLQNALAEWRKYFDAKEYAKAASTFERVRLLSPDGKSNALDQIQREYKNLLDGHLQMWRDACMRQDVIFADFLRQEIRAVDASGRLNRDALNEAKSCPATGCTEVAGTDAISRQRRKVNPVVDSTLRPYTSGINVKVRIDRTGAVTVLDIDNPAGNRLVSQAVRDAVRQWTFDRALAARTPTGCVVTEFMIEFERY